MNGFYKNIHTEICPKFVSSILQILSFVIAQQISTASGSKNEGFAQE